MTSVLATLENVSYEYRRKKPVISGLTAHFEEGRVYAVSGPSGCGKSTVLSLTGLLLRPQSGEVSLLGSRCGAVPDVVRSRARRRHVGFVFQDALLETSMTVWQNLYESLPPGSPTARMRDRAADMLATLELPGDVLDRRALELSGGQAQRVAVVRALLKQPELVLADEPTGNLDDDTSRSVLSVLFDYGRQPGHACVIVTHDTRIVEKADEELSLGA
jgi:ABC-type lipoprotein export system ATPase subunit